jgi:hypothetical protein
VARPAAVAAGGEVVGTVGGFGGGSGRGCVERKNFSGARHLVFNNL